MDRAGPVGSVHSSSAVFIIPRAPSASYTKSGEKILSVNADRPESSSNHVSKSSETSSVLMAAGVSARLFAFFLLEFVVDFGT